VKRIIRLTSSSDIQRVRRLGRSNAHPLLVLAAIQSDFPGPTRIAVIAGKSLGGAVQRNRAKRRLRGALQELSDNIQPGFDVICIARRSIIEAPFTDLVDALRELLCKVDLYELDHVPG